MRTRTSLFRSESEFVKWLGARVGTAADGVRVGIGDDAAIVRLRRGAELILKTDMSLEGVHFDPALHPARSVGHRALARPLSDIAAMGGTPRFALISLAVSRLASRRWFEEFYQGLERLAKRFGVAIVGGDTAIRDRGTFVDVALIGEVKKGEALLRSGACPGDLIYVSGRLGLSRLGLETLRGRAGFPLDFTLRTRREILRGVYPEPLRSAQGRPQEKGERAQNDSEGRERRSGASRRTELAQAVRAHLFPEPRVALGRYLARNHLASAAIDVSDGLSTDLGHLIRASGVRARIWAKLLPAPNLPGPTLKRGSSGEAQLAATGSLNSALHGGEDYELLFTVPARLAKRIPTIYRGLALHRIGEIQRGRGMIIVNDHGRESPLRAGGFDHFSRGRQR